MKPRGHGAHIMAVALLMLTALSGCKSQAPAKTVDVVVPVETVAATGVPLRVSLGGVLAVRVQSVLSFQTGGLVVKRFVGVGDHVAKGALLATLDNRTQLEDLDSARAALASAQASQILAQTNFRRQKALLGKGQTTRSRYDLARATNVVAQSDVSSARSNEIEAEKALSDTQLRADADGVISAREIERGQVVAAAQPVFTLDHDGALDAKVQAFESLLVGARPKDGITVHLVSDPSVSAKAEIREVSPVFDARTGAVPVTLSLIDPPPQMVPGAAIVAQAVKSEERVVVLPASALDRGEHSPAVWIVDPTTDKVALHPIAIARYETGEVLVAKGLRDGQLVVTEGVQMLHPGERVTPRPVDYSGEQR